MTKKMIAVDLDGTLLNSESKLSDFTIETIKKISKKATKSLLQLVALTEWPKIFITNLNSKPL